MSQLSMPVIEAFNVDTILFTLGLFCKTIGITGLNDIKPLLTANVGCDLVHQY